MTHTITKPQIIQSAFRCCSCGCQCSDLNSFFVANLTNGSHTGQSVGGVSNPIVGVDPPGLLFSPVASVDLSHVSAGQDDRDQLDQSEDDPDASVDDHHRQDVGLKLILEESHAAVDENLVSDLVWTFFEDVATAALVRFVTAGVGH